MKLLTPKFSLHPRGFSLIEVLIAVFILGIGLIMIATIFPVAGNWTRQSTDDSVSQTIAQNAFGVIQSHYGINGNLRANVASINGTLQGLPGFANIPVTERTYLYGASSPFPVQNPAVATYYWTALARVQSGTATSSASKTYNLYILVFKKGEATQTFFDSTSNPTFIPPSGYVEFPTNNVRDTSPPTYLTGYNYRCEPTVISGPYVAGTYNSSSGAVVGAFPPVGFIGIGTVSGTVFRQSVNTTVSPIVAVARPPTTGSENIIYAPPADGTTTSPLVYVYQTTVSF